MQVSFQISDIDPNVNITEAGVDYFNISNSNVLENPEVIATNVKIYPNPFKDDLILENNTYHLRLLVFTGGSMQ